MGPKQKSRGLMGEVGEEEGGRGRGETERWMAIYGEKRARAASV